MCPFCWIATVTLVALGSILLCSIVLITDLLGIAILLSTSTVYYLQESGVASDKPLWFIVAYGVVTLLAVTRAAYLLCTKRRSWILTLWQWIQVGVVKPVCSGFRTACGIPQRDTSDTSDSKSDTEGDDS